MNETQIRVNLEKAGVPEAHIVAFLSENRRVNACLDRGMCPECGAKVTRNEDPRQAGFTSVKGGNWHNYRCSCGYLIDRVEGALTTEKEQG